MSQADSPLSERRTDLDALRGVAIVLGIVLHASLSFFPCAWPVQDSRQNGWLYLVFLLIHEFRMPLFFLLSGFFTMFLFRKYGLRKMLHLRATRILLPLLLSLLTIAPLTFFLFQLGQRVTRIAPDAQPPWVVAILQNDPSLLRNALTQASPEWKDPYHRLTPIYWSAMAGNNEALKLCLERGADINQPVTGGNTPLHAAALFAHPETVNLLLAKGADPTALNQGGKTPREFAVTLSRTTPELVKELGLKNRDTAKLSTASREVFDILSHAEEEKTGRTISGQINAAVLEYHTLLQSDFFCVPLGPFSFQLFTTKIFDHLWFLWMLSWLVAGFALVVHWGFLPAGRHLPWIPIFSLLPQVFMVSLGADLWMGLLFPPHMIAYYACFFWFGASVFAQEGMHTRLGARWKLLLPAGLLILTPACLLTLSSLLLNSLIQSVNAWFLVFGLIGLFGRYASNLGRKTRWLSDATYWMYLAHLPLVLGIQILIFRWPWPAILKFLFVNVVATALLLISYGWFIRYSWVGTLLNGARKRSPSLP